MLSTAGKKEPSASLLLLLLCFCCFDGRNSIAVAHDLQTLASSKKFGRCDKRRERVKLKSQKVELITTV